MALLALRAELQPEPVVLPPYPMAVEAPCGCAFVDTLAMTRLAGQITVAAIQRKCGAVVKLAVRGVELRLGRPGEDREHERDQRQGCPHTHQQMRSHGQGLWHISHRGPSAPRCTSVWQLVQVVEARYVITAGSPVRAMAGL